MSCLQSEVFHAVNNFVLHFVHFLLQTCRHSYGRPTRLIAFRFPCTILQLLGSVHLLRKFFAFQSRCHSSLSCCCPFRRKNNCPSKRTSSVFVRRDLPALSPTLVNNLLLKPRRKLSKYLQIFDDFRKLFSIS